LGATPVAPALIADISDDASWRYVEFFTANIRNPHARHWTDDGLLPVLRRVAIRLGGVHLGI
jgi:hypothetical protein